MTTPDVRQATVQWLSALLDSASPDVIGAANWWARAASALDTAATATTYGEAVTIACRKLQIDTLGDTSARTLADLEPVLAEDLAAWSEIVHAESPYIVALTRIHRQNRRTS